MFSFFGGAAENHPLFPVIQGGIYMNEKKMNEAGYWEEKSLKRAEMLKENDGLGEISGRQYRHDSIQMPEIMAETSAALQHLVKKSLKRADAMSENNGMYE